jgi:hypothetical protein
MDEEAAMVEFTKVVQIGWVADSQGKYGDAGMTRPHFRELAKEEGAEPKFPDDSNDPDMWVEAFLRDMPNASILYKERLRKWFKACWEAGLETGRGW